MATLFTDFLSSQIGKSCCYWAKYLFLALTNCLCFSEFFLHLYSLTLSCFFSIGQFITVFNTNGVVGACHFMKLKDHCLVLRSEMKPVLKIKLSNLLLKQTGRIWGSPCDLSFTVWWQCGYVHFVWMLNYVGSHHSKQFL